MLVDGIIKKFHIPIYLNYIKNSEDYIYNEGTDINYDDSIETAENYYYGTLKPFEEDNSKAYPFTDDSIPITYYLYSSNFKLPDKDYYLYFRNKNRNLDSIKLNKLKNISDKAEVNFLVGMTILEINADTTKAKITFGYGLNNISFAEFTFIDTFDVQNCKWIVLDSTLSQD